MIVLDSNVLSELMRLRPSSVVVEWIGRHDASEFAITAISEAEISLGLELMPKGKRRDGLMAQAEAMFAEDFRGAVLPFDSEAARVFAKIAAHRRSLGMPISGADGQIAAIARFHRAAVATRDVKGFRECGVEVLNPWGEGLSSL